MLYIYRKIERRSRKLAIQAIKTFFTDLKKKITDVKFITFSVTLTLTTKKIRARSVAFRLFCRRPHFGHRLRISLPPGASLYINQFQLCNHLQIAFHARVAEIQSPPLTTNLGSNGKSDPGPTPYCNLALLVHLMHQTP